MKIKFSLQRGFYSTAYSPLTMYQGMDMDKLQILTRPLDPIMVLDLCLITITDQLEITNTDRPPVLQYITRTATDQPLFQSLHHSQTQVSHYQASEPPKQLTLLGVSISIALFQSNRH